jgi:hypothetical protein
MRQGKILVYPTLWDKVWSFKLSKKSLQLELEEGIIS